MGLLVKGQGMNPPGHRHADTHTALLSSGSSLYPRAVLQLEALQTHCDNSGSREAPLAALCPALDISPVGLLPSAPIQTPEPSQWPPWPCLFPKSSWVLEEAR